MKKLLFLLLLLPFISSAQQANTGGDTKYILVAQATKRDTAGMNNSVKITLTGDVVLELGDTKINCDSAVVDYKNYALSVYGNVVLSPSVDQHFHSGYASIGIANYKSVVFRSDKPLQR